MANGSDIIIKGGSVNVQFDDSIYRKEGSWNHINLEKIITRITVVDENGKSLYDSGENPDGLKWEIRAYCK
jgi:hypothetical protein